jgi:N utilization substance protein B
MAVQAVYQMAVNFREAPFVVDEYLFLRTNMDVDGETMVEPDGNLFKNIVTGVAERRQELADIVAANRTQKPGTNQEQEPLLLSVLLCGTYELLAHQDTDYPLILSSYVDVAKAFFSGQEPNLINAVLDSVRKVTRAA